MVVTKRHPTHFVAKNTQLKGWAQVNIAKRYGIIFLQLQCVFILLDSLYKLWSLWWWRKMTIRGMTRTTPACSMYLAYSSTWSTAELNKKDNGMYLAGTRGPLTHKNHLRGSPPMFASNPLLCSASETNSRKLGALIREKVRKWERHSTNSALQRMVGISWHIHGHW